MVVRMGVVYELAPRHCRQALDLVCSADCQRSLDVVPQFSWGSAMLACIERALLRRVHEEELDRHVGRLAIVAYAVVVGAVRHRTAAAS